MNKYKYLFYITFISSICGFVYQEKRILNIHEQSSNEIEFLEDKKYFNYEKNDYIHAKGVWKSDNDRDKPFPNQVDICCLTGEKICHVRETQLIGLGKYRNISSDCRDFKIVKFNGLNLVAIETSPECFTHILKIDIIKEKAELIVKPKKDTYKSCNFYCNNLPPISFYFLGSSKRQQEREEIFKKVKLNSPLDSSK